jgi:F5/8 type C domain-containing protein
MRRRFAQAARTWTWPSRLLGALVAILVAPLALGAASATEPARVLDRFDDIAAWKAGHSDGVSASIEHADGVGGGALRLDFDLAGTAGYAFAARALPLDVPNDYELVFWIRADAPVNDLQVKFVDASGENVWWFRQRNFDFDHEWRQIRIRKRQISFAWGPTTERELRHAARLEFVVAAGRDGGQGSVYISEVVLREREPPPATWPLPSIKASSQSAIGEPRLALDGSTATAWESDPAAGREQWLTLDFGRARELGGLVVHWREGAYASRYDVQFSVDGERWTTVRAVTDGHGGFEPLWLPDAETRFLKLALHDGAERGYAITEVDVRDPAFGASANAFFEAVARETRRGSFPRGFSGEQAYWTVVGIDGGADSGLLSEDGALEVAASGFSLEPFVVEGGQVATWADVTTTHMLADRYLPIPGVVWRHGGWRLQISAFASGTRERSRLVTSYAVSNPSDRPLQLRLVLAVRPFQVNPPAQALNIEGGVSRIRDIGWDGDALAVNGRRLVYPLRPPDRIGFARSDGGPLPRWIHASAAPSVRSVHDPVGYASAALAYDIALAPGETTTVAVVVPFNAAAAPDFAGASPAAWLARERDAVAAQWRAKLERVRFEVPPAAQPLIDTLHTSLAHLLVLRDGAILRPGTRAYARSWIRDGAMMSESLLRLGHADAAEAYVRWFATHQFADGKVPCCADARGADPVAENDSDGEFVFLVDEVYRYARSRALLDAMWPHVTAAMGHLDALRRSGRSEENRVDGKRAFYGLLPASISHEGYAAKPMHSYWDDFWAVKGYAAAIALARARGAHDDDARWTAAAAEFRSDLAGSLREATAAHRIAYVPGAAELGDFDPASTAIAFAPGAGAIDTTAPSVAATFERYWQQFVARRDGREPWNEYTPYELRIVGTFVRLGWRERAQELLAFFLAGRRPAAWNQWAEVVGRDPRQSRFIGDMPHGWVESDYIRAVLDLFAYERDRDSALVLAKGIPTEWIDAKGVAVAGLRTPYGSLGYTLAREGERLVLRIDGASGVPPGGFVFVPPGTTPSSTATINGKDAALRNGELHIAELPATVVVNVR